MRACTLYTRTYAQVAPSASVIPASSVATPGNGTIVTIVPFAARAEHVEKAPTNGAENDGAIRRAVCLNGVRFVALGYVLSAIHCWRST